jgi:hypothetical protein
VGFAFRFRRRCWVIGADGRDLSYSTYAFTNRRGGRILKIPRPPVLG